MMFWMYRSKGNILKLILVFLFTFTKMCLVENLKRYTRLTLYFY